MIKEIRKLGYRVDGGPLPAAIPACGRVFDPAAFAAGQTTYGDRLPHYAIFFAARQGRGKHQSGVVLSANCRGVIGRSVSGKPSVFEADFGRSIRPLPATAGSFSGRTLLSESRCRWFESIPGYQFFELRGYRSRDRIGRYERSDCRSSRHTRANPAFVQWRRRGAPNAEIPVRIRRAGPVSLRWWPSGKGTRLSIGTRRVRLPSTAPFYRWAR